MRKPARRNLENERLESRMLLSAVPAGSEFRVNSFTTFSQRGAAVAADTNGNFVVAWGSNSEDGSGYGIYAQRYNAAGLTQGSEFRVNTYTTSYQIYPAIAMDSAGDFVVSWQSLAQDGSSYGVYAQRYNSAAVAQGGELHVSTQTSGSQTYSAVAMDNTGNFVVTWESDGQDGSGFGIYAQRYNASGAPQGVEFRVNTNTPSSQFVPAIAMDNAGDFVITWYSSGQDGSSYGVYAQRYNSAGAAQGAEFRANTFTTGSQAAPSVAMDSGGDFVIAWQSNQDGDGYGIYAQAYNAAGAAQGAEFRVNTATADKQAFPAVSMDSAGDFAVTWTSRLQDGDSYGIYAQAYNAARVAQGGEIRVNTYTTNSQTFPAVASDHNGNFVVAWESNGEDGSVYGVYAQRYTVAPAAPAVTLAAFNFNTLPLTLAFTFNQNVQASLSSADLAVTKTPANTSVPAVLSNYNTTTNVATFTLNGNANLADSNYLATIIASGVTSTGGTPMAANYLYTFFALAGDADHNRTIDIGDLGILAANWQGTGKVFSQGDFNYDGTVNISDLGILASHWQQTLPASLAGAFEENDKKTRGDRIIVELES